MRIKLTGPVMDNNSASLYRRWGFDDVCCPNDLRDALRNCGENEKLELEINSGGGSVYQGFEMYSILRAHKGETVAEVQGIAGSAMSVVAAGCKTVLMSPVGNLMIHRASTRAGGNSGVMKQAKQMLDTIDESILNAYVGKAGDKCSRERFRAMMERETFMTAKEAVDCGLADGVLENGGSGADPALAVASAYPWACTLGLPSVEDLLRLEQAANPGLTGEESPHHAASGGVVLPPLTRGAEEVGHDKNGRREQNMDFENIKTAEDLKKAFPELAKQLEDAAAKTTAEIAVKAAAEAATAAERERIAGIDALAVPGFEDIIAKAKAEGRTPGETAMQIIAAQKTQGLTWLSKVEQDVQGSGVNNVPAAGSEMGADGTGEAELEADAKEAVALWKRSQP